jgi:hypothetical protein
MPYTYPPAAPTISGDNITVDQLHKFLANPVLVARRLRSIVEQRFIADRLLSGRYDGSGGAVQYETSESMYSGDSPQAVAAGAEYPLTTIGTGASSIAKTVKWGQDALVTDEALGRLRRSALDRGLTKLVNQNVKYVDSVALAAVASAVTATAAAQADWSTATAKQILLDVGLAKANILALNEGYDPDIVVIDDINWTHAMTTILAAGLMPREAGNPLESGVWPSILGMTWVATPNIPTADVAIVADSEQLGGMADEDLGGPGYVDVVNGVQAKTIRDEDEDAYRIRTRRVTVPVVNEPAAARKITGI